MHATGRCFCGAIEYAAEVDERRIVICHCTDCQILSGGAFRVLAAIKQEHFQLTKGEPRYYDKTADSGNVRRLHFCGECGTPIHSGPADPNDKQTIISLRIMTSEALSKLKPVAEAWCSSRVDWLPTMDDVRYRFERQP